MASMALKLNFLKKIKLFKIENTFQLMKICFFVNKYHGLFPFNINKVNIALSKMGLCYSVLMSLASATYMIIVLYEGNITRTLKFDTSEGLLQFNCYFLLATFITLSTCILSKYRLSLLKKVLEVSSGLSEKEFRKLALIIYVKDIMGYIFLIGHIPNVLDKIIVEKVLALHITINVFLMDMQYTNYVLILKSCFKNINDNLLKLKDNYADKKIEVCIHVGQRLQFGNLQLIKFRKLQQKHHEVSGVVKELNSVFTLQIISTVLMTFAEVTFGLYFFLLHSQHEKGIDLDKQIWYSYFITSVTYYSLKMSIMVWICQETRNESLRTGIIVHDVILDSESDSLKTELSLFSMQLLQCNNEFTSKCIVMDAKLITAVVSGIATYLLILMQFLSAKKKVKNPNESQ